ncbi:rDNA-binding RNA polymerase I transcriptional factor [Starmerella bacillaris]|uniref:rDNA-binding RNA polymerase I transcriptional factor n=1 Tax=Starmerella bacillaris TaxID=1247836 RepID=A0AAV5RRE8_STABA|nr:rDNA-binding RNA polymerase I transcriptional factor [Starmerella bacillaris]
MMAVSTVQSGSGNNSSDTPTQSTIALAHNGGDAARIFLHLTNDSLEKLASFHNPDPLSGIITGLLSPKLNENGKENTIDEEKLVILLRTLTAEFSKLDKHDATKVILALLDFDQWSQISPKVTEAYIQFCNVLVSASPKWWTEIANRVIMQFSDSKLDHTPHHTIVNRIFRVVPTSTTSFGGVFVSCFPHKSSSTSELMAYTNNLLKVLKYAPEQLDVVWEIIIQKLVELDVECEDFELELSDSESDSESDSGSDSSDEESDDDDMVVNTRNDDRNESITSQSSIKRSADAADFVEIPSAKRLHADGIAEGEEITSIELALASQMNEVEPVAQKVDSLLCMILEHLQSVFTDEKVRSGESTPTFKVLLKVFQKVVLPTSRPQSVQYIWFYITSVHSDIETAFISTLLETAMNENIGIDQRCRAMQYIASYVARAKSLSQAQVVFVVTFLVDFVNKYVNEREVEVESSLSMSKFRIFYAAVQALFYIFMFRHTILHQELDDDNSSQHRWVADLDKVFSRLINTKFNPLQYCMPDVVAMFSRIAQNEEVASCYSIIERNRWGRFRSKAGSRTNSNASSRTHSYTQESDSDSTVSNSISSHQGLFSYNRDSKLYDTFFPFQPLRLTESKKFITDLYLNWNENEYSDSGSENSDFDDSSSDTDTLI